MVFENDTLKIDPKKLKVIQDFQIPKNQKALKSFLGMTTFLRRFIKGALSDLFISYLSVIY